MVRGKVQHKDSGMQRSLAAELLTDLATRLLPLLDNHFICAVPPPIGVECCQQMHRVDQGHVGHFFAILTCLPNMNPIHFVI